MKILSISNCPLIEYQGSGYIILNFCRGLRDRGHEVDLFGPESYEPFEFLKGRATSYRQAVGILFLTLGQLTKKKYDLVEFYGGESWLTALVLSKIYQRNFLMVSHSNGLETRLYKTLVAASKTGAMTSPFTKWYQFDQTALFKSAFTQVDALVTLSEDELKYALTLEYMDRYHAIFVENGLREDYLNLNVEFERQPVIGYCGTWIERKGINLIKSDISQVLAEFPKCKFKLIGVGYNFKKEEHFPREVCSQIEVIPLVENKQKLRSIYQSISIFILPSFYESFGIVTAEAMACGCAVVVSKIGFGASLKHRQEAIVMEKLTSPTLYQGVKDLLQDQTLRLRIAKAGYQRVQNLRWDLAVEVLENNYLKWLNEFHQKKQ
ncbi:glycosyltransferase family 4 protein [Microseira sp. BLCC-F43]|jgi:glycosyltransferase involved in cell wall biosynthesis|uniref:glycosyltransferase family 4 protein n=1 Tax=Microseira sp. BLCC-F43 TaxID=3153602 RepID=UPI0035B94EBD